MGSFKTEPLFSGKHTDLKMIGGNENEGSASLVLCCWEHDYQPRLNMPPTLLNDTLVY